MEDRNSLEATIEIRRHNKEPEVWQFDLSLDAPLNLGELRDAMVAEFIDDGVDSEFALEISGTIGAPYLSLVETASIVRNRKKVR